MPSAFFMQILLKSIISKKLLHFRETCDIMYRLSVCDGKNITHIPPLKRLVSPIYYRVIAATLGGMEVKP